MEGQREAGRQLLSNSYGINMLFAIARVDAETCTYLVTLIQNWIEDEMARIEFSYHGNLSFEKLIGHNNKAIIDK